MNERAPHEGAQVRSFRDLLAWQRAMDFVVQVYRETDGWPATERYGLIQQLRRSSVSVPSNIAEGQGRKSDKEFSQFLRISHGSLQEAETQIMIARRLGYCSPQSEAALLSAAADLGRLIQGLRRSIQSKIGQSF